MYLAMSDFFILLSRLIEQRISGDLRGTPRERPMSVFRDGPSGSSPSVPSGPFAPPLIARLQRPGQRLRTMTLRPATTETDIL